MFNKKKIIHVITGLNVGGAEIMLYRLLSHSDRNAFDIEIISLTNIGPIGEKILSLGIPVRELGMKRGSKNPMAVLRLSKWIKKSNPDIVVTWMYHANLLGSIAAKLAGKIPSVWGIHHTNLDPKQDKPSTILTAKLGAMLSGCLPKQIIYCSESSKRIHESIGYKKGKGVVIPNGFDLDMFKPDPEARSMIRQELGIDENIPLIGLIGRFHPQKDHKNFIQAASLLCKINSNVRFLLCGDGIDWNNQELIGWINDGEIRDRIFLLGQRDDIPSVINVLDIHTLSAAFGEAFPLVVGEAMACGVPNVVTDVGDAASLIGSTGPVVPIKNPQVLCEAWDQILHMNHEQRTARGRLARERIREHFGLHKIVTLYEQQFTKLLDQ